MSKQGVGKKKQKLKDTKAFLIHCDYMWNLYAFLLKKFSFLTLFKNVILISRETTREFSASCSTQIFHNDDVRRLSQRKS
jgi:hypothetical protein